MKEKFPQPYIITASLLIIITVVAVAVTYRYNINICVTLAVPAVLISAVFVFQMLIAKKSIHRFVAKMNADLNKTAAESFYLMPFPSAVIDNEGVIVWYNQAFLKTFLDMDVDAEPFGTPINKILTLSIDELVNEENISFTLASGEHFDVSCIKPDEDTKSQFIMLCFNDVTDYALLRQEYDMSKPSVLIIVIDNYDDLLENAKETEKAHVSVAIEQLLEDFMSGTSGIVKKLSNDRFICILEEQHLNTVIDNKFQILDKARAIIVGERTNLTLSIGVGHGADTLTESESFAKQSLDMALGRGGDQAVVKTDGGFKFFGGVSKGIEKKSRSKTRIIANAMQELIHNCDDVFIMGHRFGDLDSIGSAIGLCGAIRNSGKVAHVVINFSENLAKPLIDKFSDKSKEKYRDIFMSVDQARASFSQNSLLIIVDTHNKDIVESRELYESAKHIVVIDHHRKTVCFIDNAVIFHHEPYASSASEMVTELIQYFSDSKRLSADYAEALLAGITLDTKNFIMKTGFRTFEAAAFLRKLGADPIAVKKLFSSSITSYQRKTQLVATAKIHEHCAIAISDTESPDIRLVAPQAADELLSITDVDASFVIFKSNGRINISARSLGNINVQVIMEALGGGGHQTMAAAQIYDTTLEVAESMLIEAINNA